MYLIFMLKTKQGGFMYHPSCFLEHLKYSYETKTPCFSHFAPTDQSVISKSRGGKNTFGRATDLRTLNLSSSVSLSLALVMNHRTDKAQGMIRLTHDELISYPTQASGDRLCSILLLMSSVALTRYINPIVFLSQPYAKRRIQVFN